MSIWSILIRNVFYPLWMRYDGNHGASKYFSYFGYINKYTRSDLSSSQNQKLRDILIYAYENTRYYKTIFDKASFSPYHMKENGDIRKIPSLTKAIVKNKYDDLITWKIPRELMTEASTGGSTGIPMYFMRDNKCLQLRRGQELFFDSWMGYSIGDRTGYFVAGSHYDGSISHLKGKIRNATCERMINFDPHHITDEYMETFANEYKKYKPSMIKCFPNALLPFARFIEKRRLKIPSVRSISCTGENLYPQQRKLFGDIFGGEVFEKVGTRESGVIACECHLHRGLHTFSEGIYIEIINSNGEYAKPGEMGKLFITDLFNKAMPFIRYEIGDMAIAADNRICECGSKLPLIEKYVGRDRDIIIDSNGNPKPGYLFVEVIKKLNLNAQLQVIQEDKGNLKVRVVKNSSDDIDLKDLHLEYQKIIGPDIKVTFDFVDKIARDPSGKFSYVKSKIKQRA